MFSSIYFEEEWLSSWFVFWFVVVMAIIDVFVFKCWGRRTWYCLYRFSDLQNCVVFVDLVLKLVCGRFWLFQLQDSLQGRSFYFLTSRKR